MPLSGCTPVHVLPASHPKSQKGGLDSSIPKECPCCVLLTCVIHTAVATLVWMLENRPFFRARPCQSRPGKIWEPTVSETDRSPQIEGAGGGASLDASTCIPVTPAPERPGGETSKPNLFSPHFEDEGSASTLPESILL
jgi:hypothetical protein